MGCDIDVDRLTFAKKIGSRGEGNGQFQNIHGIDVDEEHIVACDYDGNSVSVFSKATGASLTYRKAVSPECLATIWMR